MALQTIGGYLYVPPAWMMGFRDSMWYATLDASDEKLAFIFQAPKTGNITKLHFRTSTVATGATVDVRLETVDPATGFPTGTLKAANANAAQVIADSDDNKWFAVTLTAACAVNAGDILAFVVAAPGSGTFNINITHRTTNRMWNITTFPYSATYAAAAWSKNNSAFLHFGVEYDTGIVEIPGVLPTNELGSATMRTSSTPDEIGNMINLPFKCRVAGVFIGGYVSNAVCNFTIKLYDSDGSTVLKSISIEADVLAGASSNDYQQRYFFDAPITLQPNTNYRLTILPTTDTQWVHLLYLGNTLNDALIVNGLPCSGLQKTSRSDDGAWTQDNDYKMSIGFLIDQLDDGAGGGGGGSTLVGVNE